jgi:nicotinate-nucleotide adenylyltransferase
LAAGMTVGLYGGSFDPVHAAHVHVARTALKRLGLDRLWWLASPGNPFKTHQPTPIEDRIDAIAQAVPEPRQVVSDLEAQLGSNRTLQLIGHMQARYPRVRFVWVMGADGLAELHRWAGWTEIAARVPICVVARPGIALKARLGPAARQMARNRLPQIAASALKTRQRGWTYLTERLHPHASRDLRAQPTCDRSY